MAVGLPDLQVANEATIVRTIDGGATWTIQSSATTNVLWGVFITDANTGTAVGERGTILRTTTGGEPSAQASRLAQVLRPVMNVP
jgi:photosystem II stability/assembly factor-like uncharacterized protein